MSTQFVCSQCPTILNEWEKRQHISAKHLKYFPFECPICKEENRKHLETTEDDMDIHMSTHGNSNNAGIILHKDQVQEVELNKMIDECNPFPIQQISSTDSKNELPRAMNLCDGAGTSTEDGNAAQNGPRLTEVKKEIGSGADIIVIEDDNEDDSESEAIMTKEHVKRIAKIEIDEPSEHCVADPIIYSESNEVSSAVLTRSKPSMNISAASMPDNFADLCEEMDFPYQSRKRTMFPDNVSNGSLEGAEKRRLVASENHTEYGIKRITTSAQMTASVPVDSAQKETITKLFIVISEGIVRYETSDRRKHDYAPLSDYLPILEGSKVCKNGCEVVIQFYAFDTAIPFKYRKTSEQQVVELASLEQVKTFAQHLHSISFLWADVNVVAHFGFFKKKKNETLSQLDYCSELFSRERSTLKCKKLEVSLLDNWPLSIVTNVIDRCDECELQLEEVSGNRQLQDAFLNEIYESEMLHKIAVSFVIHVQASANAFMDKLKERFRRQPQKQFKIELFSKSKEVHKLSSQIGNCILKAKEVKDANRLDLGCVIIEQGSIGA